MNWDSIQQVVRIFMYSGGSYFFGDNFANGELYQAAIGGAVAVGAFVWWFFWERDRPKAEPAA